MGDSWIVSNLNAALSTWNDKLGEIWQLLTQSPQTFKDGQVWAVMVGIHGALQVIGYGLLVLFFAAGVVKTCGTFVEAKRPEQALKLFIRFALAKAAVTYGLDLMLAIFQIVQGMVSTVINQSGVSGMSAVTLPQDLIDAINQVGFWDSIPLWAVTLIGGLLITVLSFVMILTVYGRMFSLWMYAAIAPIPLSSFAGEPTSNVGKNFLRSYAGVCLQGVVIALVILDGRHGLLTAGLPQARTVFEEPVAALRLISRLKSLSYLRAQKARISVSKAKSAPSRAAKSARSSASAPR